MLIFYYHSTGHHKCRETGQVNCRLTDVHTNTIEGYFSILKRGLNGVYQHVSPKHLKRYLAEYDFRYSYRQKLGYDDMDRANMLLKGIEGKRLMYK